MRASPLVHVVEHVLLLAKSVASHPWIGLLYANKQPSGTETSAISWKLDRLSAVLPTLIVVAVAAETRNTSWTKCRRGYWAIDFFMSGSSCWLNSTEMSSSSGVAAVGNRGWWESRQFVESADQRFRSLFVRDVSWRKVESSKVQ